MKTLLLLVLLAAPANAADLEALLKQPVTPGSTALLLPHLEHEAAQRRLWEALAHLNPQVRATAARVAFVRGLTGASPLLRELAERETDPSVAIEQLRALAADVTVDDRWLLTQARRAGVFAWFLPDLARQRGPAVLPLMKEMGRQEARPPVVPFAAATRDGREELAAAVAVAEGDPKDWAFLLLGVAQGKGRQPVPDATLVRAIGSSDAEIRRVTYWYLALQHAAEKTVIEGTVAAALDAAPDRAAGSDPSVALALDLADRARGRKPARDWSRDMPKLGVGPDLVGAPLLESLSKKEREALALQLRGWKDGLEPTGKESHKALSRALVRASGFPPGMVASMLTAAGCAPSRVTPLIAEVEYRRDGRAQRIGILTGAKEVEPCADVQKAAVALGLAPNRIDEKPFLVMTIFDLESLRCLDEVAPRPPVELGDDVKIYPPKTTHRVQPTFPSNEPRSAHAHVMVSARLAPSGCVQAIEVTESAGPGFDMAAMLAVSQWRYEPTIVNGQNIPIVMRIGINFGDPRVRFPRR